LSLNTSFLNTTNAANIYVPKDYSTIQSAINYADNGDKIYVASGTYNETLFINKNITLIGKNCFTTIIDANGLGGTNTVTFYNVRNAKIENFTIKGATYDPKVALSGNGIMCMNSWPIITNNIIKNNDAMGIICLYNNSAPSIINNLILRNSVGIFCNLSSPIIVNNLIVEKDSICRYRMFF
jgi:nitrous oxidase accessory protein NosD